jgi:hypothetical protein
MLSEIRIQNFKSIHDLTLKPGRVTVLIGENGSGKSNILEAITFAAAGIVDRLDNDYFYNRGMRVTNPEWILAAFPRDDASAAELKINDIHFSIKWERDEFVLEFGIRRTHEPEVGNSNGWKLNILKMPLTADAQKSKGFSKDDILNTLLPWLASKFMVLKLSGNIDPQKLSPIQQDELSRVAESIITRTLLPKDVGLLDFLIYSPENTILRNPPSEGAIQPVGPRGEGLFKLLQSFNDEKLKPDLDDLKAHLKLFGWFDDILPPNESEVAAARIQLRDRWLPRERQIFDQRSANEGFLYVLFYLTILISKRTPDFFAIDNLDNALNPRLCTELMKQIVSLAKARNKQVICTTHNPAVLDGLDLSDDEQRLFIVRRDSDGHTVVNRVLPPKPQPGETPVRLSEACMRGLIGGVPVHF